jgi:transcriptional regulator with XRE-family HTH domain
MEIRKRVALRLRAIRKRRGLSQEQLAELIDRSPDAISNIERGVSVASYETLEALASGLGIPVADFFADSESESPARTEAMTRLTDAARQLDDRTLVTAAGIIELLAANKD